MTKKRTNNKHELPTLHPSVVNKKLFLGIESENLTTELAFKKNSIDLFMSGSYVELLTDRDFIKTSIKLTTDDFIKLLKNTVTVLEARKK
jgi:hypothetical protein